MDVNSKLNFFLNTYFQIINSCFPKTKVQERQSTKQWLTKGITNSCKIKELYILVRSNNDEKLNNYYLKYSKILLKIILTAKKLYYNNIIIHAHNKIKATWKVINEDMRVKNGEKKERDENIDCENYSLKINAENCNGH
jgi:hypothetical protein